MAHRICLSLACLLFAATAAASENRTIRGTRIELGELVQGAPERVRDLDLGPAPPPGGTRLFGRDELITAVRRAGADPEGLSIPASIRATTEKKQLSVPTLAELGRAAIETILPEGVAATRVIARRPVDVSAEATLAAPELPSFPKRAGSFQTTVIFPVVVNLIVESIGIVRIVTIRRGTGTVCKSVDSG
jgi:hypothetical protein